MLRETAIKLPNALLAVLVGIVLLSTFQRRYWSDSHDPYKCSVLLNEGQWLDEPARRPTRHPFQKWQPKGCLLKEYHAEEIIHCAGTERQLLFIGDSNVRQLFWAVAKKLDHDGSLAATKFAERHGDIQLRPAGADLRFIWDPFLNSSILTNELQIYQESIVRSRFEGKQEIPAILIVIGGGLWHARQFKVGAVREFKKAIDGITNLAQRRDGSAWKSQSPFHGWEGIGDQVFFLPVEEPVYERLSPSRQLTMQPDEIDQMNDYLRQLEPSQGLTIPWVNQVMTTKRRYAYEASGLHVVEPIANRRADIILNLRCNAKVDNVLGTPYDRTCCSKYTSGNWFQWVLVTFGLIVFPIIATYFHHRETNFGNSTLITAVATIGLALSYSFFADRSQLFNKVHKMYHKSEFLTLCGIVLTIGLLTSRKSKEGLQRKTSNLDISPPKAPMLPREQIEEWKGWMQAIVLIYHWTGASKELWVYITVRLLIASYIFLTGYEHALYFYERGDFSIRQVASVLIRLNVLVVALSYQMYTNYLFYYFAPLLSFWFLVVYFTFRFGAELNDSIGFLLGKICLSAALMALAHTQVQPLEFISVLLRVVFRINWDVNNWRHQMSLDPFIAYVGIAVALLDIWYRSIQSGSKTERETPLSVILLKAFPYLRIAAIVASIIIFPSFWLVISRSPDQNDYNWWQPIISILPILSFMVLRNSFGLLRNHHSASFAWLGRCSVETFTLSYHLWMAADSKGVLSLGIFNGDGTLIYDRWRDFILLTPIFLLVSWQVSRAADEITKWLIDEPRENDRLPIGIAKAKESPLAECPPALRSMNGSVLRSVGARFVLLLVGLWILNFATC